MTVFITLKSLKTEPGRVCAKVKQVHYKTSQAPKCSCISRVVHLRAIFTMVTTKALAKFVDWRQCAAVMQREAVTLMPSCSGGGNVVVA
jgi:hypothetical protein